MLAEKKTRSKPAAALPSHIDPVRVHVPLDHAFVFRADPLHCGDAWPEGAHGHVRVHTIMDSRVLPPRGQDLTNPVTRYDGHGSVFGDLRCECGVCEECIIVES